MRKSIDLMGKKFGHLTVVCKDEERSKKRKRPYWFCKCDCGNPNLISICGNHLKNGHTKSCGCIVSTPKSNNYVIFEDYAEGEDANGNKFKVDIDMLNIVKKYTWGEQKDGYFVTVISKPHRKCIFLHRLIMNLSQDNELMVDHINHDKSDNRKNNLRVCTRCENLANSKINCRNTTGIKGVCYDKNKNKYVAYGTFMKKYYPLGRYDTLEEAGSARSKWEQKYQGEFAYNAEKSVI